MRVAYLILFSAACLALMGQSTGMSPGLENPMRAGLNNPMGSCSVIVASCDPLPGSPSFLYDSSQESYANNDPVSTATDQGSIGVDATQATSTAQPTYLSPCESGKLGGKPCYDADGGDFLQTGIAAWDLAQANLICWVMRYDSGTYVIDSDNGTKRHAILHNGGGFRLYAGAFGPISAPTVGDYHVWCASFDGASSAIRKDGVEVTGNAGTQNMDGISIFSDQGGNSRTNGAIAVIVGYDTPPAAADVEAVLNCRYGTTPQALSTDERLTVLVDVSPRVKRYVVAALKRGIAPPTVVNRVVARTGVERAKAEEMVQRSRGRRGRDPDTLHTAHVGLLARRGSWGAANTAVADALCKPLADEVDPDKGGCDSAELRTFGFAVKFCRVSDGVEVIRAARGHFTADEASRLDVAVRATSGLRQVLDAEDKSFSAAVNAFAETLPGAPTVEPCPDAAL